MLMPPLTKFSAGTMVQECQLVKAYLLAMQFAAPGDLVSLMCFQEDLV